MKNLLYVLSGIAFGIIMVKSEAVSWFRIQEMFRFQSIHMYGIIGSAVVVGAISLQLLKRMRAKDLYGDPISFPAKPPFYKRALLGGIIFGLGWAMTGACPGPMFVNAGAGYPVMFVVIACAVLGAFVHGLLMRKLP